LIPFLISFLSVRNRTYADNKTMLRQVAADICAVFIAPDRTTAEAHLAFLIRKYEKTASRLADRKSR